MFSQKNDTPKWMDGVDKTQTPRWPLRAPACAELGTGGGSTQSSCRGLKEGVFHRCNAKLSMEGTRVRLYFDDRHMLSKSQRLEGLKRCWLLLTPDIITISDLVSLVIHKFALEDACPNGLILSMDGFVLPEFESTCIFQDKDIVRVKKKGGTLKEIIRIDEEVNHIEDSGVLDKQPLLNGVKLLTNEKFKEDTQSEHEEPLEDASDLERPLCASPVCKKKRKNSDKLQSSKRKKARPTTPELEPMVSIQCLEKDVETQQNGSEHHKGGLSRRRVHKKDRLSNVNGQVNATIAPVINDSAENVDDSKSTDEGCVQFQEKSKKNAETSHVLDATRKLPSRSARRKKAKRQWLRGQKNSERKEVTQNSMLHKDMHKDSPEHTQTDPTTDMDDEIVPVVIRPGHIRFEPLDEGAEENNQQLQSQNAGVTLQWSGTTNKKKGQKWGKERTSVCGKSDDDSVENCNDKSTVEEGELARDAVDFEKLMPLSGLPKEGDVIAYRLVELLSSWSPELSSFRVGKTSFYDTASNMVKLVSVPGYKMSNEELQSNISPYNEDGSLEINFASLFDVRIFIHDKSLPTTVITRTTGDLVSAQEAEVGTSFNCSAKDMAAPVTENGGMVKGKWDEISQALTEKKAQLMKRNGWGTKESSDKAAWSYKALRSSALGPTVALLRARNDLQA